MAEKGFILSAEEELKLREPIDEYIGKIQEQIDALRLDGTDKVRSLKNHIAVVKESKNLSKEEKTKIIENDKKVLEEANAVESRNKDKVNKLIAEAEDYLSKNYNSQYYNKVVKCCEAEKEAEKKEYERICAVLKVEHLCNENYNDVSFELHKGEILGFFGLVGAGRTEVMRTLIGADQRTSGKIILKGKEVKNGWNTTKALKAGIGLLPEDRKTQGFMNLSNNYENIAISSLEKYMTGPFTDTKKKIKNAEVYFEEMDVHPRRVDYMTSNMSGGNQQKVILARWMSTDVDIIIFDEPTKGVDVGAKAEIYRLMEQLVEDGKSIIVVSSELPEAMGISDRMIIMSEGRITAELTNKVDFVEDSILDLAIGGNQNEKYMG